MKPSKSLSGLNQKYRGKPKKYAEGGTVRRPAAAPVASPFDPDYIERLAAQAVGAGEPVTELRSAEGRGFAPMPRSFGEAGQRMSAVIRGDVEPTPEEERQMNVVRGFAEGPAIISPATARAIQMETRLPQDKKFLQAVENTPGARISDEGLALELLRYQKPEQAGAQAVREGVFYLPATLPSRSVGTYRGSNQAGYGGSEMVRGETLLRAPLAVPGNTGGTVPELAYRELTSGADLKKLISDVREASTIRRILGQEDYRMFVEDFLSRHGGNPSLANEIIRNSNVGNRMRYALQENAIGAKARNEGYDSIVGTGARTPRITEVFDLREGAYPVLGRPEFETLVPYFERLIPGYAEGGRVGRAVGAVRRAVTREAPEATTLQRGVNPSNLIFREPVQNRLDEVANMFPEGGGYPPIVAAQTDDGLLILDGHNRVRVAQQRNETIDAVVIPESVYRQALSKGLDEVDLSHAALELAGEGDAASAIRQQFRGTNWEKSEADARQFFDRYEDARQQTPSLEDLDRKYAEGGAVSDEDAEYDSRLLSRMKAQMGRASEPTRAEQMQALRTAGRSAAEGLADVLLPQSPLDVALMVALGPGGRAARLAGSAALASLEPSEAEAGGLRRLIRAYHGSPYAFERFDISKIGTGEGNQAYGRGLYFADKEAVARTYFDDMVGRKIIGGSKPDFNNPEHWAASLLDMNEGSRAAAIKDAKIHYGMTSPELISETVKLLRSKKPLPPMESSPGHMYEVRLRTTPEEMVNWNAPLVQQPERAIPFLEDVLRAPRTGSARVLEREMKPIGEAVDLRTPEVAAQLREAGIPGLRYLDAGSRSGGRGTRNYVMFGDDLIDITRRYAEGGLAALDEKYADGGTVRAPKETTIAGQDHKLAYITDREAALLKARGGSGRMTEHGVRAYNEGPGGDPSDNANSNSEAATQDAAGGNAGQGAGPTGAGAGATGEPGPGPTGAAPTGEGQSEVNTPGQAPGISTEPTTNINIGLEDQANAAAALGALANAPIGFEAIGVRDAIDMFDQGRISFADLVGYGLNNMLGPPGTQIGVNVNPRDQTQTPAYDISIPGLAMGALGMISGIPGLGMLGGRAGTALGNALDIPSVTVEYSPGQFDAPTTATSVGEYSQYGQPGYGTPGLSNIATSMAPATAAPLVDWNQIQREASAMNMSVSDYLAMKWRSPATMARGGMASLEKMHAKYAEGGDVRAPAGEVAEYNPEEIDRIARQIHLRFPEEDLIRPGYEDVESPSDLTMRARLMMRGQNVGLPETVGMGGGNDMFSSSTSMRNIPIESEPYGTSQRMLNTGINAVLDAERKARIGAGMLALERSGERGFTGYGPQLSVGYGPASIYGGYQAITPNISGAKSQGSYVYGGNLNIPIDESGTEANIGGTVMSGRRGQGGGPSGTQIMGSLERPLLGGRLALELAADPSLRHKEILLGYRRAF